ncbi:MULTISPECIES: MnhB domain-containing protein [unclassified Aureimonas]|uniref:MnhB domain-containing protein n=1 Tax=unclassified Aureimonas TaxID=2615206 RepID=UPI0006FE80F6|nr:MULTISPECIES: MnhB domain-containing protein [unclassified Aureimonas]KQT66237.1 cation:proton antiporter [Aureimonas sp. Leaf427]KQT72426.1 cation:proton antiporter [Aureimonas sp. Leaf460]
MNSPIFRAASPLIAALLVLAAIFIVLRGHNEPGGGFIGGLLAAGAVAMRALAGEGAAMRRALRVDPAAFAAAGLLLAALAGLSALLVGRPLFTGLWWLPQVLGSEVALSTPLVFDLGVFATVFGTFSALILELSDKRGEGG